MTILAITEYWKTKYSTSCVICTLAITFTCGGKKEKHIYTMVNEINDKQQIRHNICMKYTDKNNQHLKKGSYEKRLQKIHYIKHLSISKAVDCCVTHFSKSKNSALLNINDKFCRPLCFYNKIF